MDKGKEGASPTHLPRRVRTKTPKALELERNAQRGETEGRYRPQTPNRGVREARHQDDSEGGAEDSTDTATTAPDAPRPNRTTMKPHKAAKRTDTATDQQTKGLTELVTSLLRAMEDQKQSQANQANLNETLTVSLTQQIEELKAEMTEMRAEIAVLRETIQTQRQDTQATTSATPSYAQIARTPPESQPSNLRSLSSMNTTPTSMTDTLYCTVDTSRVEEEDKSKAQPGAIRQAIEQELRKSEDRKTWRCVAATKDPRNTARIRITCRNEVELQLVKEAAEKSAVAGARVLRDQLYPVKIDNANRSAILDQDGAILTGVREALGKENEVSIAKLAWLSKKDTEKAYGSMVIYVTRRSDAVRLLQAQYFHVAGESAYTRVYVPRTGPTQCYNCQAVGHKAFSCTKPRVCAKCAQEGHHHDDCREEILKCVPCGGPHESFSRNCRVLYPTRHA